MAAGKAPSFTGKDRNEFLECGMCLDIYTSPKLLSCFHTFCEQCLKDLNDRSTNRRIRCPSCRKETLVPPGGVSAFQRNFYIDPEALEKARAGSLCAKHPKLELDWFCVDCDEIVCVKCAMTDHKNHETEELSDRAAKAEVQLRDDAAQFQQLVADAETHLTQLTKEQKAAQDRRAELLQIIRHKQFTLKAEVDRFAEEAVASVDQVTNDILKADVYHLQEMLTELTSLQKRAEAALNCRSCSKIVAVAKEMRSSLGNGKPLQVLTLKRTPTAKLPVLFVSADSSAIFELIRGFMGRATKLNIKTSASDVIIAEQFYTGESDDTRVFCVCPLDTGSVLVSFELENGSDVSPSQCFDEKGNCITIEDKALGKASWTGRAFERGVFLANSANSHQFCTFAKSPVVYKLSDTGPSRFNKRLEVLRMIIVSADPFQTKNNGVFTINCYPHRAFDVDRTEQLFAVVQEAQAPFVYRNVLLFCYPIPDAICTYSPPVEPFQPADVCFYTLGGHAVLLVADELNDAIHVVKATKSGLTFLRYLSPGCPLLVQPTALNTDITGRLWVACRGGRILTCTPVSTADGTAK